MFKNVLVGVDGSANGRDAIALASRLIDRDGKLTLAHVYSGQLHPLHAITPGLVKEEHEASRAMLERERAGADVTAELISLVGLSPGRGLHECAVTARSDLIVVGSCGRGLFGRAMMGDDTRDALNGAPCAVAVSARGFAEHPKPIAKVGVGYNASPESVAALAAAREIAAAMSASVSALEVVTLPSYAFTGAIPVALGEIIQELIKESGERMRALPDVDGRAVYGLTGEELAGFGDEVDMLVVGSRGYGPVKRLVLGSTSSYLERHARCSLLVLTRVAGE